jgi:chemotaxis protein histidine kinase CheA
VSESDADLTELFRDEAAQRLDQMDTGLLAIEAGDAGGAETVNSLFRNAHTIKGAAGMLGFDDIRAVAHAAEDVLASVRAAGTFPPGLAALLLRATAALRTQVTGAGEPVDDLLDDLAASRATFADGDIPPPGGAGTEMMAPEATGLPATGAPAAAGPAAASPAAGSPAAGFAVAAPETDALEPGAPEPGEQGAQEPGAQEPGAQEPGAPEPVAREAGAPEPGAPQAGGPRSAAQRHTLRVPAEKIDHLLDVAGEIMQDRRRLAHSLGAEQRLSEEIADVLGAGQRMLDDLKDTAVGMRTLPLSVIAGPLPRAVRDLALAAGKDVEFVVTGADTELDRVILESLSDPLVHLLRNAVVHGVESPAERELAGKRARGRVELRAVPRGSLVEIVVADDGRGVSPEVIKKARHEGSLTELLARAGYSTAAEVTDLAGRGVGLDAVRTYARSLGGSLEVRSEPGRGMDVVLLLPVALALAEVLLFGRGGAVYGVPLAAVEEVVTVTHPVTLQGRPALEIRGKSLPVYDFAELVGAAAPPLGDRPPALVIAVGGRRVIASCDTLLGQEEVVIKSLGPLLAGVEGYLGASILGDGRIALLVEPAMLARGPRQMPGTAAPDGAAGLRAAPRILVVEDSFTVRELQRSILEAAGYPVATARDGRDALAALHRDAGIALVVTDLEMPELDGIGLTRAIRADAVRSSLPVVIVTSHGSEDDRRRGIEAGADAYMAKQSFDQQALLSAVERLVGR